MSVAPGPVAAPRRLYDLLPPEVQQQFPLGSIMPGYRPVLEQPVPATLSPERQAKVVARLAAVLPQATTVASIRRSMARTTAPPESPAQAAQEREAAAEAVYQRMSPAGRAISRVAQGIESALPSFRRTPLESPLPPAKQEWEKWAEAGGGLAGFTAVAAPVTIATGGVGAGPILAGAVGAGVAAAAPAGTVGERAVRGGVTAALSPVAEVAGLAGGNVIGRRLGAGAAAKAVTRYVAQPAATGAVFGTAQPAVENQVRKWFGMEQQPFTLQDAFGSGGRLAVLSAITHGVTDVAGRAVRPPAGEPPLAAPHPRQALDDFLNAPGRTLAPAQVAEAAKNSDLVSQRLAGRVMNVAPEAGLEPVRVRIARVNVFPGEVRAIGEDPASGVVIPLRYRSLAEMNAAIAPAAEAPPAAAPKMERATVGELVRPTTMRETISEARRTSLTQQRDALRAKIAADPGNAKRGQWENKAARLEARLGEKGAEPSPVKPQGTMASPVEPISKGKTTLPEPAEARGKVTSEESLPTPPPSLGAPPPQVTAPAGVSGPRQETAGAPALIVRASGEKVDAARMPRQHLYNTLIKAMRTPDAERTPEQRSNLTTARAEIERRGLTDNFKQYVEKKAAAAPAVAAPKASGREPAAPPPAAAARPGDLAPAPPVAEPGARVKNFAPGERVTVPYTGKSKLISREHGTVKGYLAEGSGKVNVEVRHGKRVEVHTWDEKDILRRPNPKAWEQTVAEAKEKMRAAAGGDAVRARAQADLVAEAHERMFAEANRATPEERPRLLARERRMRDIRQAAEGVVGELGGEERSILSAPQREPGTHAAAVDAFAERVRKAAPTESFIEPALEHQSVDQHFGRAIGHIEMAKNLMRMAEEHVKQVKSLPGRQAIMELVRGDAEKARELEQDFSPEKIAARLHAATNVAEELGAIKREIDARLDPPSEADNLAPDLVGAPWSSDERGFIHPDLLGASLFRDVLKGTQKALARLRREQGKSADMRVTDARGNVLKRVQEYTDYDEYGSSGASRFMAHARIAGGDVALPKHLLAKQRLAEAGAELGLTRDVHAFMEAAGDAMRSIITYSDGSREFMRYVESGGKEGGRGVPDAERLRLIVNELHARLLAEENALRAELGLPAIKPHDNYVARLTKGAMAEALPKEFLATMLGRPADLIRDEEARDLSMWFHEVRTDFPEYQQDFMISLLARLNAHHRFMQFAPVVHELNRWLSTEGALTENRHRADLVRAWMQNTFFPKAQRGLGWWNDIARKFIFAARLAPPAEISARAAATLAGMSEGSLSRAFSESVVAAMKKGAPKQEAQARYFIAAPGVEVSQNAERIGNAKNGDVLYRTVDGTAAHGMNELRARSLFQKMGVRYHEQVYKSKFKMAKMDVSKEVRQTMARRRFEDDLREYDRHPLQALFHFLSMQQLRALLGWNVHAQFQNAGNTVLTTLPEILQAYGARRGLGAWAAAHGIQGYLTARSGTRWLQRHMVDFFEQRGFISRERAAEYRKAMPYLTAEVLAQGVGSLQGQARRATESARHLLDSPLNLYGDMLSTLGPLKGYQFVEDFTRGADALAWVIAGQRVGMKPVDIWKSWGSKEQGKLDAMQYVLDQAKEPESAARHAMMQSIKTMFDYGSLGRPMALHNPIVRSLFRLTTFPLNWIRKYEMRPIAGIIGSVKDLARGGEVSAYHRVGARLAFYQMIVAGSLLGIGSAINANLGAWGIPGWVETALGWLKDSSTKPWFKKWYQMAKSGAVVQFERGPGAFVGPTVSAALQAMESGPPRQKDMTGMPAAERAWAAVTDVMWPAMRGLVLQYTVPGLIQLRRAAQSTETLAPLRKPLGAKSYLEPSETTPLDRLQYETGTLMPERQAQLQRKVFPKKPARGVYRLPHATPTHHGRSAFNPI